MTPFATYKRRRNEEIRKDTCHVFAQRRISKREEPALHQVRVHLYDKRRKADATSEETRAACS
jgi:hypothetical protein